MKERDSAESLNVEAFEAEVNSELEKHAGGYELSTFERVLEGLDNVKDNFPGFEDEIYCMALRRNEFRFYKSGISTNHNEQGYSDKVARYADEKKCVAELTVDMTMLFDKLLKKYSDPDSIQNKMIKLFDNQIKIYRDKDYLDDYNKNYAFHVNLGYAFSLLTNAVTGKDDQLDLQAYENYMNHYPVIDSIRDSQEFYTNEYKPYMAKKAEGTLSSRDMSDFREKYKEYLKTQMGYYDKIGKQHDDQSSEYFKFTTHDSDFFRSNWIAGDLEDQLDFLNMGWPVEDLSVLLQVKKINEKTRHLLLDNDNIAADDSYNELLHKPVTDPDVRKKHLEDVYEYIKKHNDEELKSLEKIYNDNESNRSHTQIYQSYIKRFEEDIKVLQASAEKQQKKIDSITKINRQNFAEINELQNMLVKEKDPNKKEEISKKILEARNKEGVYHENKRKKLEEDLTKNQLELEHLNKELNEQEGLSKTKGLNKKEREQIEDNIIGLKTKINNNETDIRYDTNKLNILNHNKQNVGDEFSDMQNKKDKAEKKLEDIKAKIESKENAINILKKNEEKSVKTNDNKKAEIIDSFMITFDNMANREVKKEEFGPVDAETVEKHAEKIDKLKKDREKNKEIKDKEIKDKKNKDKKNKDKKNKDKKSDDIIFVGNDINADNVGAANKNADEFAGSGADAKLSGIKEFATTQLRNLQAVDRFVRSSSQFKNIKTCLARMNAMVFDPTWNNDLYAPEENMKNFLAMAEELKNYAAEYLLLKKQQIEKDPSRKDSWRKQFNEQPRISTVINLVEQLDTITDCVELELSANTTTWKEYVSQKKDTIQANAKDRISKNGDQIIKICQKSRVDANDERDFEECVTELIANHLMTTEGYYKKSKHEDESQYRARMESSLNGEYVSNLVKQLKGHPNCRTIFKNILDDCKREMLEVDSGLEKEDVINKIIETYNNGMNIVNKSRKTLVSTKRTGKTKGQAVKKSQQNQM